jgi:hypothetical protein
VRTVEIDDGLPCPEIVRKALQFERCSPSDDQGACKQCLKRYDSLLPCQGAKRALEGSTCRLNQPASRDILAAQTCRIAVLRHPPGIDQEAFREGMFEKV